LVFGFYTKPGWENLIVLNPEVVGIATAVKRIWMNILPPASGKQVPSIN
jgi:hypothetical protein